MIPVFNERSEMMFQAVFLWVFFADGFRLKRKQAFAVVCNGQFQLFCQTGLDCFFPDGFFSEKRVFTGFFLMAFFGVVFNVSAWKHYVFF